MPNRPGNDDRNAVTGQRDTSNDNARQNGSQNGGGTGAARTRSNRGFASMDREKQKEIASKGGRAAHAKGTAHEFDSGEAREAGRKGGMAVSRNREHMAAIGRRGGEARGANRAARLQGNGGNPSEQGGASAPRGSQRFQTDREVGLSSNSGGAGMNAGAQGTARQSGNSLGGERRPASSDERNVERP